jgi:glycosyltransferase involved in cell wall biosynthesis
MEADGETELHIASHLASWEDRGPHWASEIAKYPHLHRRDAEVSPEAWLCRVFESTTPTVVVAGGVRDSVAKLALRMSHEQTILCGIFAEQPNPASFPLSALKAALYRFNLQANRPRFVLAVGDRAQSFYRRHCPAECLVFNFPYHQDLSFAMSLPQAAATSPVRFLFSGRLLKRNSIAEMTWAFSKLSTEYPGEFEWVVSGEGPEESTIRREMQANPRFAGTVSFERTFIEWNDRLAPFSRSHVLMLPSRHSGWGLVVPEALASGLPVVSTRHVESARYYVDDGYNGWLIAPAKEAILECARKLVEHPELIRAAALNARRSAAKGTASAGAEKLRGILGFLQA